MAEENAPEVKSEVPELEPIVLPGERNVVTSFITFLRQKIASGNVIPEQIETMEIAIQCLEGGFNIDAGDYVFQLSRPLIELVNGGVPTEDTKRGTPTEADSEAAAKLKNEGNDLMKAGQFDAAIAKYNAAIALVRDPVYFCNRAAAYCRQEAYDLAIQDCRTALALDPNYSKAYGRMGLAYSCQHNYEASANAYRRALELEPNQESYKNNLSIAEEKIKEAASQRPPANPFESMFGGAGMAGMPNFGALMNDPNMMNMAQQLMTDPSLNNMFGNLMGGNASIGDLMAAGQQMAARMQETNPEMIENLRRQFGAGPGAPGAPGAPGDGSQPPAN